MLNRLLQFIALLGPSVLAQTLDCTAECYTVTDSSTVCSAVYTGFPVLEAHCGCTLGYKSSAEVCATCLSGIGETELANGIRSDAAALDDCGVTNFFATGDDLAIPSGTVTDVSGVSCSSASASLTSSIASCQDVTPNNPIDFATFGNCLLNSNDQYQEIVNTTFAVVQCGLGAPNLTVGDITLTTARLAVRLQRLYIDSLNALLASTSATTASTITSTTPAATDMATTSITATQATSGAGDRFTETSTPTPINVGAANIIVASSGSSAASVSLSSVAVATSGALSRTTGAAAVSGTPSGRDTGTLSSSASQTVSASGASNIAAPVSLSLSLSLVFTNDLFATYAALGFLSMVIVSVTTF